jgi:epimerase transport system membrane fusion protein
MSSPHSPSEAALSKRAKRALYEIGFYKRLGYFVSLVMFLGFFAWMAIVPLKGAIVTDGKVVTKIANKVVQHPTGGIVSALLVKEGDLVTKGQILIRLSDVQVKSQLDIVTRRWQQAKMNLDRLRAERDHKNTITWSPEVQALLDQNDALKDEVNTQIALFEARKQAIINEQAMYDKRISQTKQQMVSLDNLIRAEQKRTGSLSQDLQDWVKLYEKRFTDKVKVRDLQRQLSDLEGSIASRHADVDRLGQSILETERLASQRQEENMKDISEQIKQQQELEMEASYQRTALLDELNRLEIMATEDGRVAGLEVTTVGAVVDGHRTLMYIVPANNEFMLSVKVKPTDIDQVFVGQSTEIKFTAFRLNFIPVIYGEVVSVGADALPDDTDKRPYYRVRVSIPQEAIDTLAKQQWQLVPGMPANAYLKTRERTLLNFMLRPFELMIMNAFNEDDGLAQ